MFKVNNKATKTTPKNELMKKELDGRIMKESVVLIPKMYSYLADDGCVHKKEKNAKKCVIKRKFKLDYYKISLENNKTILRTQQRFKSDAHNRFTKKVKKTTLSAHDNKRIKTFNRVISYPHVTGASRMCKAELLKFVRI